MIAALALAAMVAAAEYFARHYLLFWMPVIGSLRVNDMVALALAYSALAAAVGVALGVDWRRERQGIAQAVREMTTTWTYMPWIAAMMVSLVVLSVLDQFLWGRAQLPMWVSEYRNSTVMLAQAAGALAVVATIAVNGVLVPICEEFLWRGQIQARLARVLPAAVAIGATAVLFSLKHVLVDASWGRFLTLVAFGAICGLVALRRGWWGSAALHAFVNTATTVVSLVRETELFKA